MSYRKTYITSIKEDDDEDIVEFPSVENDIKEDFEDKDAMNKDIKTESDINSKANGINAFRNTEINDNLLKFIENIVLKNLRRNKVANSNTRANEQNLKILDAKNRISIKTKNIKKQTPLKKIVKKISTKFRPKPPNNWIFLK